MMTAMPPLSKPQVEVRVNEVVAQLLASGSVEDDLVECKAQWPDPAKIARQLAGMANTCTPEPMIWIIGIDERARRLTNPPGVEVSNWLAQLEKPFDGGAPSLAHHLNITLPTSDHVTALTFDTDRAPYVVTVAGQGNVDREVPYRSGTGTRSAKRAELLSILTPTLGLPDATILEAQVEMTHREKPSGEASTQVSGRVVVFLDVADRTALVPNHTMSGTLLHKDMTVPLRLAAWSRSMGLRGADWTAPGPGVTATEDGLLVTAPGSGTLEFSPRERPAPDAFFDWAFASQLELDVRVGVTGVARLVHLSTTLRRIDREAPTQTSTDGTRTAISRWRMRR